MKFALVPLLLATCLSAILPAVEPTQVEQFEQQIKPFLTKFCAHCHGGDTQEADFALHDIDGRITGGKDVVRWEKILEMVSLRQMPPEEEPQPSRVERRRVTNWIAAELRKIGRGHDSAKLALPSQANRIGHEDLFSGEHQGPAYTPARLWRKSPHIYSRFANDMRTQVSQPLHGLGGKGIQDYASLLADEATIQTMLRNSNLVVDRMMFTERAQLFNLVKEGAEPTQEEIDRAIRHLFLSVFQREPTEEDRQRYIDGLFEKNRQLGGLELGLRTMVVGMLMSQEFVFRLEIGLGEELPDGRRMLSPMEIAYALSFAFYDQPDRTLIKAAQEGRLATRADVAREVRRILDSEEEKNQYWNYPMYHMWHRDYYQHAPRVLRFFQEFFGYTGAVDVFKDRERNPQHHANRLRKDADFLVLTTLKKDQNVLEELLTTNCYFIDPLRNRQIETALNDKDNRFYQGVREKLGDEQLEAILKSGFWPGMMSSHVSAYNLVDDRADAVRRRAGDPVEFPKHERAGMLTHPAWLVAHSGNFDNDPIRRGKWIRERLLADLVPEVPIGVDAKVPEDPHRTLRERLDVVRKAECWRCHKQMNPLGEVFEAYDDFGRYRERILVGDVEGYLKQKKDYDNRKRNWEKQLAELRAKPQDEKTKERIAGLQRQLGDLVEPTPEAKPVDTRGELRGTGDPKLDGPVEDAVDLVHRLAKSDRVRQSFVRHAFRYWMGRNETLNDSPTLIAADRAYVENDGSFKEMLVSLLTSDSFLTRKDEPAEKH